MRVLHLPSTFFPDYTGGKEVFVQQLIKNNLQHEHIVVIHREGEKRSYVHDGIRVLVLTPPITSSYRRSYYSLVYDDIPGFIEFLYEFKPDIVHFHDQSEGASLTHLRICKMAGIKTVLTYHSPGQSCLQRALIQEGKNPCDGIILLERCTYCRYTVRGIPKMLGKILSTIELPIDSSGRFALRKSTQIFKESWTAFYEAVDAIQVHAYWVKEMLLRNQVPEHKIHYIKFGGHPSLPKEKDIARNFDQPLKMVFVGRCIDSKGVHLLIEAVKKLPDSFNIEVHFFGPYWDDSQYGLSMQNLIQEDIRFKKPRLISPDKVREELSKMDFCVIPSLWPETGPFTVLDAFAAGLPVIGTNLAGIAERVQDGVNGLLFEWNNSTDLSNKILWLIEDPDRIDFLKEKIPTNHTFESMGADFYQLYLDILMK